MGEFFEAIREELDMLDTEPTSFGADYTSNAAVIKEVQAAINALGYSPPLATDGAYGPLTKAGVQWMQEQKGLTADGIVGDQTLGALGITPPAGASLDFVTGTLKGAAADAVAAIQAQFPSLLSWASNPKNNPPLKQGRGVAPGFAATKASVVNSFVDWSTPFEGMLTWMYLDRLGWITTGMGNKIDPISQALALKWQRLDGSPASSDEVAANWNALDAMRSAPKGVEQPSGPAAQGGGTQGGLTSVRLTPAAVQQLISQMLKSNENHLVAYMPSFPKAPADAQLAAHSMSWAMGTGHFAPGGDFTHFTNAFNAGDYATAAAQARMKGTGIERRNDANQLLLQNAAHVVANKKDPDYLYYLDFDTLYSTSMGLVADAMRHPMRTALISGTVLSAMSALLWYLLRKKPAAGALV